MSAQPTLLTVRPRGGRWALTRMHQPAPLHVEKEREPVVARALDSARRMAPSELVVRNERGGVDFVRHFGPDVYPPDREATYYYENFGSRHHEGSGVA